MQNEVQSSSKDLVFPFDLKPIVAGNKLTFKSVATHLPDARELVTMDEVLQSRGWEVSYD
jgi:hypothetical protein